jgi:hypothetical protein
MPAWSGSSGEPFGVAGIPHKRLNIQEFFEGGTPGTVLKRNRPQGAPEK